MTGPIISREEVEALQHRGDPAPAGAEWRLRAAIKICRDVGELPDRTSPDDNADMMLVTVDELRAIVTDAFAHAIPASPSDIDALARAREALSFYADPIAWKRKHDPLDDVRIPDFYSETSFGDKATDALKALDAQPASPLGQEWRKHLTIIEEALGSVDGTEDAHGNVWDFPDAFESLNAIRATLDTLTSAQAREGGK